MVPEFNAMKGARTNELLTKPQVSAASSRRSSCGARAGRCFPRDPVSPFRNAAPISFYQASLLALKGPRTRPRVMDRLTRASLLPQLQPGSVSYPCDGLLECCRGALPVPSSFFPRLPISAPKPLIELATRPVWVKDKRRPC